MVNRRGYLIACLSSLEAFDRDHEVVNMPDRLLNWLAAQSNGTPSRNRVANYFVLLLHLKILELSNTLHRIHTAVLKDISSCIGHLESHKNFSCSVYNMSALPPSWFLKKALKFSLIQFSSDAHSCVLSLQCSTFQELNPEACFPIVGDFFLGYAARRVAICLKKKWTILQNVNVSVVWVVQMPMTEGDINGFRNDLLQEKWNCYYDDCDWCQRLCASPDYLDRIIRFTGGASLCNCSPVHSRKRRILSDYDDVVFAKFSDSDPKGFNPIVLLLSSVLVLLFFLLLLCAKIFFPLFLY